MTDISLWGHDVHQNETRVGLKVTYTANITSNPCVSKPHEPNAQNKWFVPCSGVDMGIKDGVWVF